MIKRIISLGVLLVMAIFISACEGCSETGNLYELQEAYDNGWLTVEDLKSVVYYYNGGTTFNEEIMGENYMPIPKVPEILDAQTAMWIKQDFKNNYRSNTSINSILIVYLGTYNGLVAVILTVKDNGANPIQIIHEGMVGGVLFKYDNSIKILVWKA